MVQTELASLDIDTLPLMQALQRAITNATQMEVSGYFSSMVDRLTDDSQHRMGTPTIAEFTQMITGWFWFCVNRYGFSETSWQHILSTHPPLKTHPIMTFYQHTLWTHDLILIHYYPLTTFRFISFKSWFPTTLWLGKIQTNARYLCEWNNSISSIGIIILLFFLLFSWIKMIGPGYLLILSYPILSYSDK